MESIELKALFDQYLSETITDADLKKLWATLDNPAYSTLWEGFIDQLCVNEHLHGLSDHEVMEMALARTHLQMRNAGTIEDAGTLSSAGPSSNVLKYRVHFLHNRVFRYAAAAIIVLSGVAMSWWIFRSSQKDTAFKNDDKSSQIVVLPGGDRALLTLADGRTLVLDSAANGQLADQGGVQVVKDKNGEVLYDSKGATGRAVLWNTLSTPKGGQFRLVLPDGSKVWLNATSSIRFPAIFSGHQRSVKITGEVYFEVAKNKSIPFIVDIDGKSTVEVLGTSFNINDHGDDGLIKTTLIEGSVKVISNATAHSGVPQSVVIQPGQQAQINQLEQSEKRIIVKSDIDLEQVLAWKNGLFNFEGMPLSSVVKQLERWYDIEIKYDNKMAGLIIRGGMYRNLSLSDALEILQGMGLRFRMEGRILLVEASW